MTKLLEMKNITKLFGAVKAIDNISLTLESGEVMSLCGENGSGKSTLMKVLCGLYPAGDYQGAIFSLAKSCVPPTSEIPSAKALSSFIRN